MRLQFQLWWLLVLLLLTSPLQAASPYGLQLQPQSSLMLLGNSSLHKFYLEATQIKFLAKASAEATPTWKSLVDGSNLPQVQVTIPVMGLKAEDSSLAENAQDAMDAKKHPEVTLTMEGILPGTEGDLEKGYSFVIQGKLTIHGVTKPVEIPVTAMQQGENLQVKGKTELLMSHYGIKPPTMMMGVIKTDDLMKIEFDFLLSLVPGEPAPQMWNKQCDKKKDKIC